MPLPKEMDKCMSKVKGEFPEGRSDKKKGKKSAHKQHVAMCLNAGYAPTFGQFIAEADEMQRLRDEMTALYKERDRYPKFIGMGRDKDPRRERLESAIKAKRDQIQTLKDRMGARSEIETGRQAMQNAPPVERTQRAPTSLKGEDLEAAIRMGVEELAQGEAGTVAAEDVVDFIRKNFDEEVARTTVDRHLSNNPNLRDLEKFRKVGRQAGTTDRDREMRYLRNLKQSY